MTKVTTESTESAERFRFPVQSRFSRSGCDRRCSSLLGGRLLATMLVVITMLVRMMVKMLVRMMVRMLVKMLVRMMTRMLVFVPPAKGKTIHTLLARFLL